MGRQLHPLFHLGGLRHRDLESLEGPSLEEEIQEHSHWSREDLESSEGIRGEKEVPT